MIPMEAASSNAIEDPRVRDAIEHYLLDLENTRSKNTKRNYLPKQKKWKDMHMGYYRSDGTDNTIHCRTGAKRTGRPFR
jgi:hypothetical protein